MAAGKRKGTDDADAAEDIGPRRLSSRRQISSRSLSPALVTDYQLHLPRKDLLTEKLRELKELAEAENGGDGEE